MKLDDDTIDVLIGGYLSTDAAQEDYDAVLDCGGHLQGAVVVSKDLEGNLSVDETDHMVREGAAGLGAVGFAVGLFAPPLLAATAIGAAIGRRRPASCCTTRRREARASRPGTTIPIGGAGLIVAYPHSAAEKVEPAVTRAVKKVVGEAEGTTSRRSRARWPTPSRRWPRRGRDEPPWAVRHRHSCQRGDDGGPPRVCIRWCPKPMRFHTTEKGPPCLTGSSSSRSSRTSPQRTTPRRR